MCCTRRAWSGCSFASCGSAPDVATANEFYFVTPAGLVFGLGSASKADRIEVFWPSGLKESFTDIEANHVITVRESAGIVKAERLRR